MKGNKKNGKRFLPFAVNVTLRQFIVLYVFSVTRIEEACFFFRRIRH